MHKVTTQQAAPSFVNQRQESAKHENWEKGKLVFVNQRKESRATNDGLDGPELPLKNREGKPAKKNFFEKRAGNTADKH